MLVTDYTIEWLTPYKAKLLWNGSGTSYWWTVYVDGMVAAYFQASGSIEKIVSASERESHSIAIVRQTSDVGSAQAPEASRLLRPIISWMAIDNAAEYLIYELNDSNHEFLLRTEPVGDVPAEVYSWEVPANLPWEGLNHLRCRVYAKGSWGLCEVPFEVSGLVVGYPSRVASVSANESSLGIGLLLEAA